MSSGLRPGRHAWTMLISCVTLTACSDAPSVGVLGAYFPDWLLLVACVHVLLSKSGRGDWLTPPAIVYPALTVLFSIALWAMGFNLLPTL
jgi:hypothetical protein